MRRRWRRWARTRLWPLLVPVRPIANLDCGWIERDLIHAWARIDARTRRTR